MLPDSFGLVRAHSNVVVLRTFSKAYGLAGLRIGYAVGDPDIITALGKVYVPFTATSISQAAAIASLDAADELLARTDAVVAERARVTAALRDAGYTVPPSQANFVWLPLPGRAQEFANGVGEQPHHRAAVRRGRRAGHRRRPARERRLPRVRPTLDRRRMTDTQPARRSPNSRSAPGRFPTPNSTSSGPRWSRRRSTFMIGEWKGGEFDTGHRANGCMDRLNWFGKTFHSATDAKPLVCLDDDGNKFSNTEAMKGEASLWLEEFRGEVTATMVYDGKPIHDHFKLVDDDAVIGIMNGKGALDGSIAACTSIWNAL